MKQTIKKFGLVCALLPYIALAGCAVYIVVLAIAGLFTGDVWSYAAVAFIAGCYGIIRLSRYTVRRNRIKAVNAEYRAIMAYINKARA